MKTTLKIILFINLFHRLIGITTNDNNFNASLKTAQMLVKKGDTENAVAIYLDLNKRYPNNYSIVRSIKNLYIKTNKYEEGISFLKSQLELQPEKHQSYIDLGEFYLLNNQIEKSRKIWGTGVKKFNNKHFYSCLLYTSPSPRD